MDDQSYGVATKMTKEQRKQVAALATSKGLTVAEWLRRIIRRELEYGSFTPPTQEGPR